MASQSGTSKQKMSTDLTSSPIANRTRTRKIQSGIKHRVESFLEAASPTPKSITERAEVASRKRKLADVDPAGKKVSSLKEDGSSTLEPKNKSRKVSKLDEEWVTAVVDPRAKLSRPSTGDDQDEEKQLEEKRLRPLRKQAPQAFYEKLHRATTQRMIVIDRTRTDTKAFPKEDIAIVGSTGNIYTVTIGQIASCTCPDHAKGNECKHKVYALHTVLKAPSHLQYQRAFLSSELREIFAKAPPLPTDTKSSGDTGGNRKPAEGECAICYMDFDEAENELVWCKAACGNNTHKTCFEQWAASQRGQTVKCVHCRTPWQVDSGNLKELTQQGTVGEKGYVNVAGQFGMSGVRDYSTYHQPWVRRRFGGWGR